MAVKVLSCKNSRFCEENFLIACYKNYWHSDKNRRINIIKSLPYLTIIIKWKTFFLNFSWYFVTITRNIDPLNAIWSWTKRATKPDFYGIRVGIELVSTPNSDFKVETSSPQCWKLSKKLMNIQKNPFFTVTKSGLE